MEEEQPKPFFCEIPLVVLSAVLLFVGALGIAAGVAAILEYQEIAATPGSSGIDYLGVALLKIAAVCMAGVAVPGVAGLVLAHRVTRATRMVALVVAMAWCLVAVAVLGCFWVSTLYSLLALGNSMNPVGLATALVGTLVLAAFPAAYLHMVLASKRHLAAAAPPAAAPPEPSEPEP